MSYLFKSKKMWPYGMRRVVPHPTQNLRAYNPGGYVQNQQGTSYSTYAPYLPNPPYLQQDSIGYMTYAPYPQYSPQEIGFTTYAPYLLHSQQEMGVCLLQDPMANNTILQNQHDQNWPFQNHFRKETMPEYRNGEVVMVKCNQQKWLKGIFQRMSAQGVRVWIIDANVSVNVPLVLLPTHVFKMPTHSRLESLPQIEPMWTIINNGEYQKVLVQCVRPAHLSHRQLFHMLDNNMCAICKMPTTSSINLVSPWNCGHQVHNYCLQFQIQQSSIITCLSCNENATHQLMPLEYSNNAFSNLTNEQQQLHQQFELQCNCGFKSLMTGNVNTPLFCPNCHQSMNANPMTINTQSVHLPTSININPIAIGAQRGEYPTNMNLNPTSIAMPSREPLANMNVNPTTVKVPIRQSLTNTTFPQSNSKHESEVLPNLEILQDSESPKIFKRERFFSAQDFKFGWPTQSSIGSNRLEAIEEGREGNTSSLELITTNEEHEESLNVPLSIQALQKTFEINAISNQNDTTLNPINQGMKGSFREINSQNLLQDDLFYEPLGNITIPTQNKQYSNIQNPMQIDLLNAPYFHSITPIQHEQFYSQNHLQNNTMGATPTSPTTSIQSEQSSSQNLVQAKHSFAPTIIIPKDQLINDTCQPIQLAISLAEPTTTTYVTLAKTEEGDVSKKKLEMDKSIVTNNDGKKLWKKDSESNSTIAIIEGQKLRTNSNESKNLLAIVDDERLGKWKNNTISSVAAAKEHMLWKKASELNTIKATTTKDQILEKGANEIPTTITINEGKKIWEKASESNVLHTTLGDQNLWKKASESNTTLGEGKIFLKRASEPNTTITTINGKNSLKRVSEPNISHVGLEDQDLWKRKSDLITRVVTIEEQNLLKRANEPNMFHVATKDQRQKKQANEIVTTFAVSEGLKIGKGLSNTLTTYKTLEDYKLWKKANEANKDIIVTKGQELWKRASDIDWTIKVGDDEESKEKEKPNSYDDFGASSSSIAPMYVTHLKENTEEQILWRRASATDWTNYLENDEENEESEEVDLLDNPTKAPTYVNHFADFVKLAMAGSSTAEDIIASASPSASSSTLNPPPIDSATPTWISPPAAFFTRASSIYTKAPTWITQSKIPNAVASISPNWITVIKDGVDSRKDDKQWELEQLANAKESSFL